MPDQTLNWGSLVALLVVAVALWTSTIHCAVVSNEAIMNWDAVSTSPQVITCWTCPNRTSNTECNQWAPDITCPVNHTICRTVHRINIVTHASMFVNKQCMMEEDCTQDMVGCHNTDTDGVKDCVSCCNYDYCNEQAPTNHSTALSLSTLRSKAIQFSNSKLLLTTTVLLTLWLSFRDVVFLQMSTTSDVELLCI